MAEKEATVETLRNEKQKMEDKLESERLKYEEKIRDLEKSQAVNELMQQDTFEKMNREFAEKMGQNQNEFETAIKEEKKEREEERQRLAQELKVYLLYYNYSFNKHTGIVGNLVFGLFFPTLVDNVKPASL